MLSRLKLFSEASARQTSNSLLLYACTRQMWPCCNELGTLQAAGKAVSCPPRTSFHTEALLHSTHENSAKFLSCIVESKNATESC